MIWAIFGSILLVLIADMAAATKDLAIKAFQSLEGAYFPTEVEHFIYEEIIENSSLLYGPQTDFKKIWQDKLSALADKAWNDYHTQVTE